MNRGDLPAPERRGPMTPGEYDALARAYADAQREMVRLREQAGDDPEMNKMVEQVIRDMQSLDPRKFPGNPALLERLRVGLLPNLQYLELQLRRKLDDGSGAGARSGAADKVPAGYTDQVAEYFRKLSRGH
jgi:hypothetical protein